ncbi:hypothetical protein [Gracilibacillus sp. YIM 98692]|uniref:hypothetical protein n=1 Tax=Gracilibacillus sp. YIM 98692 TaxID=2663532 RepID=UPI0013D1B101|nr:hypothetical protein [Gracilibacillus sp. YIM 98692]
MLKSVNKIVNTLTNIIPNQWLGSKVKRLISLLFSSILVYMMGYLFLWGYYFGGNEDFSLFSMVINYIPINKPIAIFIGIMYLITISIIGLFLISFFVEGFSFLNLFYMVFSIVLTNMALSLFFYGETSFTLFIKMLKLWELPFLLVVVIAYFYVWIKHPGDARKFSVYIFLFMMNMYVLYINYPLDLLKPFLFPELFLLILYFGLPTIIMFKKVKNTITKIAIKFFMYLSATLPLIPALIQLITSNIFFILLLSLIIMTLLIVVSENNIIEKLIKVCIKKFKKTDENYKNHDYTPLFIQKPMLAGMFFLSILLIVIMILPNVLIRGGDYFQSVVFKEDKYQEISYFWNGNIKTVKGIIVSNQDNTLYISTSEQSLMIVKAQYSKTE